MKKAAIIYISKKYIKLDKIAIYTFVGNILKKRKFDCAFIILDNGQKTSVKIVQKFASLFRAEIELKDIENFLQGNGLANNVKFCEASEKHSCDSIMDSVLEELKRMSVDFIRLEFVSNSACSILKWKAKFKKFMFLNCEMCVYSERLEELEFVSESKNLNRTKSFDVIFHILGREPIPILYALKEFKTPKHIFIASSTHPADNVSAFVPEGTLHDTISIDPFSSSDTFLKISEAIKANKWTSIGFNLTGGTKMMYDGAMQACRQFGGIPFYFDINKHNLIWLNSEIREGISGIKTVDDFFKVANYKVSNEGFWKEKLQGSRIQLTLELWKKKEDLKSLYKKMPNDIENPKPFSISIGNLSISWNGTSGQFTIGNKKFSLSGSDFVKYAKGGWFEGYVYINLMPLIQNGAITDMRIGYTLDTKFNDRSLQEFDILFTDSKTLYILECKAGNLNSEHLDKLQNNIIAYAGVDGKGAIISAVSMPNSAMNDKILRNNNLNILVGRNVPTGLKNILNMFNNHRK